MRPKTPHSRDKVEPHDFCSGGETHYCLATVLRSDVVGGRLRQEVHHDPYRGSRFSLWPIGTQPEVPCRLSGLQRIPTETSFIPFTDRGLTAPPVANFHPWSYSKNFQRSCPCHVSTSSALRGVWRHTARFEMRSSTHRDNRVWTARRRRREHLIGTGPGYWGVSLTWLWSRVPCADVVHSGSLPPSPRSR
jgi:hypothetical protein